MWKHLAKGISLFGLTFLLSIKDEIKGVWLRAVRTNSE